MAAVFGPHRASPLSVSSYNQYVTFDRGHKADLRDGLIGYHFFVFKNKMSVSELSAKSSAMTDLNNYLLCMLLNTELDKLR